MEIKVVLQHLVNTCDDHKASLDAKNLSSDVINFEFLFVMIIWYYIVSTINKAKCCKVITCLLMLLLITWKRETYIKAWFEWNNISTKEIDAQKWKLNPHFLKKAYYLQKEASMMR